MSRVGTGTQPACRVGIGQPGAWGHDGGMGDHKERMMLGEPYLPEDAELTEDRLRCARLLDRFNAAGADANDERRLVLGELLGAFGPGSWIMPPFRCDYGYQIRLGRRCFVNYD